MAEDLSTSPDVTWRTLTSPVDPILQIDVPGFGTFEQIIRDKLADNGLTIPFGKAKVEVVNGKLRALTAGVQALQGCIGTGEAPRLLELQLRRGGPRAGSIRCGPSR